MKREHVLLAVESRLRAESAVHGDLVQTDYLDTYKNLTYKAVSWMKWVDEHCSHVENLVKTDDDIAVDVFRLDKYLAKMRKAHDMSRYRKFHCYKWRYGQVRYSNGYKVFGKNAISQTFRLSETRTGNTLFPRRLSPTGGTQPTALEALSYSAHSLAR